MLKDAAVEGGKEEQVPGKELSQRDSLVGIYFLSYKRVCIYKVHKITNRKCFGYIQRFAGQRVA